MKRTKLVGEYCNHFRTNILKITLKEVCKETNTSVQTLSSFEKGHSTNIEHIYKYIDSCNPSQQKMLMTGISWLIRNNKNGKR